MGIESPAERPDFFRSWLVVGLEEAEVIRSRPIPQDIEKLDSASEEYVFSCVFLHLFKDSSVRARSVPMAECSVAATASPRGISFRFCNGSSFGIQCRIARSLQWVGARREVFVSVEQDDGSESSVGLHRW